MTMTSLLHGVVAGGRDVVDQRSGTDTASAHYRRVMLRFWRHLVTHL